MDSTADESSSLGTPELELSEVVVPLLKGVLYAETHPERWAALSP